MYDPLKRFADIAFAVALLVILSPLLLVIAVLVRLKLGAPVVFTQERPGRYGRLFTIYKFRSMRTASGDSGAADNVATDAQRLSSFGRRLRSTSLDELPSLWNVLIGDMSFVGPRPLLPEYLERYNTEQARRHEVRPGITGWAQVNGRNMVSWEDRFAMDVWYVDHRSLPLDMRIVVMTFVQALRRGDVSADGHATMPPFEPTGTEEYVRLLVIGAGGHAKVVVDAARAAGFDITCVLGRPGDPAEVLGVPVVDDLEGFDAEAFIVAIGDNRTRADYFERYRALDMEPATVVHPSATVAEGVRIGAGTIVAAGAVINVDARVGDDAIINTGCTVDHDCVVGDHALIGPTASLCGASHVGTGVLVGAGSSVIPGVHIGEWTVVGAGAAVVDDLPPNTVCFGVPARPVRKVAE